MPERIALIVNPAATRAGPALRARVVAALTPLGLVEVLTTERGGHGSELATRAAASGATLVVVVGGDGTVNEAAGALAGSGVALAAVPAGSTNVFARALGWPHPAARAVTGIVDALYAPTWRDVTLGRVQAGVTDRVFCVNAGLGLDADAVHLVEARPWLKTRLRHAGFGAATILAAVREARSAPSLLVSIDGREPERLASVIVVCGSPYAYLGPRPLDLVPGADFGGHLRWMGLRTSRLPAVGAAVAGALRGGRHLPGRSVAHGWATQLVLVHADRPVAVQADGEPLGWHTQVRLSPGPALRTLVAPRR